VALLQQIKVGTAALCLVMAAGCTQVKGPVQSSLDDTFAVSGIAVLPVRPVIEFDENQTLAEEELLRNSSVVMDGLIKEALADKSGVRFITTPLQVEHKGGGFTDLEKARDIAAQQECNTLLEVTLSRYVERIGGDYGVRQPAAVTFAYRLYEVGEGRVLCHGRFDEQQQSVMENLLTLPKAQSRGLVWLTAEDLARDGIKEKFSQCPYLDDK